MISPYPWEWFCTFTFSRPTHPEAALRYFKAWVRRLNIDLYGRNYHKEFHGGVYWVVALERHQNGNPHLHALLLGVFNTHRLTWMDRWNEFYTATEYARIEPVRLNGDACEYVTKYVAKEGEIYFSDNFGDLQKLDQLLKTDQFEL